MPTIVIEGPPLGDIEKKRRLVAEVSAAASTAFGIPVAAMVVIIKDNPPENVGVGGRLLSDRKE
ncbi:MAG: 4-oxalocrotonate tautomerase DmpI [Longimicrobiales bacterium]|jgi:4-oxalocrotonate tautomerase|nr:tautomerase family protein [Acidobacteriota bacterium]MBE3129131.1 tautomerase family protein [Acidobacteriota bacterium]MCX6572166.1 tautomerase family protein [Candidatus Aminicenantes bacterium]MDP2956880.1 4-oxalocrotonate tautomerase DmpI [Longimicrobiales bacterium]